MVRAAVFYIMDEDNNGVGVGVFFSKSKAVTADHNLTVSQGVGTQVVVQTPPERGFYKLRPANKTDHLCQSWQYCHMFMKFRQSIT